MSIKNQCFSIIPEIKNICNDYFKALNLDLHFFGHITVFPDGKYHFLCSNQEWPKYGFVDEKIPPAGFTIYDQIDNSIKLPHMDSGSDLGWDDETMRVSKERFGIENFMMIYRKHEDHYEGFSFDLHDKKSHEKYINHFDIFENFIFYYKDRAQDLIKIASKNQLEVDVKYLLQKQKSASIAAPDIRSESALYPKQYFLTHGGKDFSISAREYQCLALISHGKKIKGIANYLRISPRTVDDHIKNLKDKLNIHSTTKAIEIYWSNRIRGSRHE